MASCCRHDLTYPIEENKLSLLSSTSINDPSLIWVWKLRSLVRNSISTEELYLKLKIHFFCYKKQVILSKKIKHFWNFKLKFAIYLCNIIGTFRFYNYSNILLFWNETNNSEEKNYFFICLILYTIITQIDLLQ